MAFYGPTFPNEAHYETLLSGRQRFGNRSANMFFVRPARHIACPRRLKYIHDIKTGYIPYVEDSTYPDQSSYKHVLQKMNDDMMNKNNGLGLYNSADAWRHELTDLAQQVKCSLLSTDEQEQYLRQIRSARSNKSQPKRSNSLASTTIFEDNEEQNISKRLLTQRRTNPRYQQQSKILKSKSINEKSEVEQTTNDETQDPGIWLIPILCYILQIDNIFEAQDWLVNANPTEKRLAMELISRTMQDMQNRDNEILSDISTSDLSSTTTASTPNLNNIYWPYKILQRQEKDRQQQIQNYFKQPKLSSHTLLPSLTNDNSETCERATSPIRMVTPAKRLSSTIITTNNYSTPNETTTTIIERTSVRNGNDRTTPTVVIRQNQISRTEDKCPPSSRSVTPIIINGNDRLSRRSYRVTTSLNNSTDEESKLISTSLRGRTPLI